MSPKATKPLLITSSLALLALGIAALSPTIPGPAGWPVYGIVAVAALSLVAALMLKGESPASAAPVTTAEPEPEATKAPAASKPNLQAVPEQSGEVQVAQLLSLLQEKGRFLDFVMDDIKSVPDAQVAAAARFVHQGCQAVLKNNFTIEPVAPVAENQSITLADDYRRSDYRLTGKVGDTPPHQGTLTHKGWKTTAIKLPQVTGARAQATGTHLIAPAEVDVK